MEIGFLKELGFKEEKDINKLKISLGFVEFDEMGRTSKIITPDLRYYWEEGHLGLHISDSPDFDQNQWENLLNGIEVLSPFFKILYIGRTKIEKFKSNEYLVKLEFLNLSENKMLIEVLLEDFKALKVFEISNCSSLSTLRLIGDFNNLKTLDVSNSNLNIFHKNEGEFLQLFSINISGNKLFKIHDSPNTPNLHFIYGYGPNDLVDNRFFEDKNLNVKRYRNYEMITQLGEEIKVNLKFNYEENNKDEIVFLDLGHLGLDVNAGDKLPKSLFKIFSLEHLCLGAYYPNKLNVFDNIIWKKSFYHEKTGANFNVLSSSELEKLKELPNLKSLYLNSIDLDSLDFLKNFPNLQSLDITGSSRLNNFENLHELKELKLFHASIIKGFNDSQTQYLPTKLISLSLESCSLKDISFLENLKSLKFAFLGCNQVSTGNLLKFLFTENGEPLLTRFSQIKYTNYGEPGIYINENPIEEGLFSYLDSKDLKEKERLLVSYYAQYQNDKEEIRFKQVKLILLGNTKAGKTTFFDILNSRTKGYKMKSKGNESTHGVNITTIERLNQENKPGFVLKVYDFGGQDYYHSTHWPYFTQTDTQYLLLFRNDKEDVYDFNDQDEALFPLEYWLDSIKKYCLVSLDNLNLTTKVELLQNLFTNVSQDLNLKDIKNRYRNELAIRVLPTINLAEIRDDDILKNEYNTEFQEILQKSITNETAVSKERYSFIKQLKEDSKGIIQRSAIKSPKGKKNNWLDVSLDFAASTNDIIYSKESDYIITDIEKFNSYIFKILKNEKDGYFNKVTVDKRLENESLSIEEIQFILNFMIQHEIIFVTEGNFFLAPSFLNNKLSVSEKILVKTFKRKLIEYRFKAHFHSNIFTKIVLEFSKANEETQLLGDGWRYVLKKGHVFLYEAKKVDQQNDGLQEFSGNLLYIKFELKTEPKITVYNHSLFGLKDDLIEKVHMRLNDLVGYSENNDNIQKFVYDKYGKHIDYIELKGKTLKSTDGKNTELVYYDNQLFRLGDFRLFLDSTLRNQLKMKKIFISYSRFDEAYKEEFVKHLVTLEREGIVETFDDRKIDMGDSFDPVIKQKIEDCDYFICLVSVDFLNVKYVIDIEIPLALKNNKRVIPIIIKPCDWYTMPFETEASKSIKFGEINAHNKAAIITLRPEFNIRDEKGNLEIKEYTGIERQMMWLQVVNDLRKLIDNDHNESIPPNSPTPSNEHLAVHHQTDGGEQ
jgi:internalin A